MNERQSSKIKAFVLDESMYNSVFNDVRDYFLDDSIESKDVNHLAAERIALSKLYRAFKNLHRFKNDDRNSVKLKQVGL